MCVILGPPILKQDVTEFTTGTRNKNVQTKTNAVFLSATRTAPFAWLPPLFRARFENWPRLGSVGPLSSGS